MTEEVRGAANMVWQYMLMNEKPAGTDCLLVLGSRDERVAVYAAELASRFHYDEIVISGGSAHHNDLLATSWSEATEAEHFLKVMRAQGFKREALLELQATNTGENAIFSYELLKRAQKAPASILLITKPYMERRAKATFAAQWPNSAAQLHVVSPPIDFDAYCNEEQPLETVTNIMVGDLDRIMKYPARGLQVE